MKFWYVITIRALPYSATRINFITHKDSFQQIILFKDEY